MTDYATVKCLARICAIEVNIKCFITCDSYYFSLLLKAKPVKEKKSYLHLQKNQTYIEVPQSY